MHNKLISICIPAYKHIDYLQRLLDSIAMQTFQNFEVIVSDDSPDESVQHLCSRYTDQFSLHYYKNVVALGTPANWNFAISKANGEWIKLMHDDDWFANKNALLKFVNGIDKKKKFIFSAYTNHFTNHTIQKVYLTDFWKKRIIKEPAVLMAKNVIGPPSVTLLHKSIKAQYDERLKWRVDTEFYDRVLQSENDYTYIAKPLLNVGISESQVTQSCLFKPEIELPEGYILLQKQGAKRLQNIIVYDAWWRLLRNMNITTGTQLKKYTSGQWPAVILRMINDLKKLPPALLRIGVFSKFFMCISYFKNRNSIH